MSAPRALWITSAFAVTAVALWGLAFPLIQDGLEYFSPVMLGFVRFGLASSVLAIVIIARYPLRQIGSTVTREWKPLLALALLYVAIPNIAQNIGLENETSSIASVIQSSGPVMTLIFAVILLKEGLTRLKAIGTVIAMTGTVLLVASEGLSLKNENFVSNLLILVSAASYGLAWVSAKKMIERNPPLLVIGLSLVIGTGMLAVALPFEDDSMAVFNGPSLMNILVLGIFCAGASSVLYLSSLEHEEVSRIAFFVYLMPLFASAFAWILRDEGVAAWTAICGLIIVVGIVIANKNGRERPQVS